MAGHLVDVESSDYIFPTSATLYGGGKAEGGEAATLAATTPVPSASTRLVCVCVCVCVCVWCVVCVVCTRAHVRTGGGERAYHDVCWCVLTCLRGPGR
jgi:hypothetical protein